MHVNCKCANGWQDSEEFCRILGNILFMASGQAIASHSFEFKSESAL